MKLFEPFDGREQELYKQFLLEHKEYATIVGYDLSKERGLREAMADNFLYSNFLAEEACIYS